MPKGYPLGIKIMGDHGNVPLPSARPDWRPRWSAVPPGPGRYCGIGPRRPEAEGRDRKEGRRCEAAGRPFFSSFSLCSGNRKRKVPSIMKTITVLACAMMLISSFSNVALSQIQSWPPGGTSASPITAAMKLPGNRYVPSTKKYNLVWADELVGQPAGKIRFIAQNYVASQKMAATQVADYRAYNADFLCVIYHLSNGINPQNNGDCPLPHGTTAISSCTPAGWVRICSTTSRMSRLHA